MVPVDWKLAWDRVAAATGMRPGAEQRVVAGNHLSVAHITMAPDAVFDGRLHHHDNDQLIVGVSGVLRLRVGDDEVELGPGDVVFVPGGVRHGSVGVGPEGAAYLDVFAPARVDQLPGWRGPSPLRFD